MEHICSKAIKEIASLYNIDSTWKCYSFEANPYTYMASRNIYRDLIAEGYDITHANAAVYVKDGSISIKCVTDISDPYISQRSNVMDDADSSDFLSKGTDPEQQREVMVKSIDFVQFLLDNVTPNDYVVVKMDVEGAEFGIIERLLETGAYELINDFYCEFHENFYKSNKRFEQRKKEYINALVNAGVNVGIWN